MDVAEQGILIAEAIMRRPFGRIATVVTLGVSLHSSHCQALSPQAPQKACLPSAASECPAQEAKEFPSPLLIIGFCGGFVKHTNMAHGEVEFATHLRQEYPAGVDVEIFENHQADRAYRHILQRVDRNHDGSLSKTEKQEARIILYGHSWGGSETVAMARRLQRAGIPVLLTIQVDSVEKYGEHDGTIPANVLEAVNFYQQDGLLHGRSEIRAADPAATRILGNFRFQYKHSEISSRRYSWYARLLTKPHIEIESDPRVWKRVDSLIRTQLPVKAAAAAVPFPLAEDQDAQVEQKPN
jgi:hypothetical protein